MSICIYSYHRRRRSRCCPRIGWDRITVVYSGKCQSQHPSSSSLGSSHASARMHKSQHCSRSRHHSQVSSNHCKARQQTRHSPIRKCWHSKRKQSWLVLIRVELWDCTSTRSGHHSSASFRRTLQRLVCTCSHSHYNQNNNWEHIRSAAHKGRSWCTSPRLGSPSIHAVVLDRRSCRRCSLAKKHLHCKPQEWE